MRDNLRQLKKAPSMPAFVLMAVSIFVSGILMGGFRPSFIKNFIFLNGPVICVTLGVAMTIIVGGIDISLGSIVSMTNVILVAVVEKTDSIPIAVMCAMGSAVLAGAVNGVVVGCFRIAPLLATFATQTIFSGIALWIRPYPGGSIPYEFSDFMTYPIAGLIPISVLIVLFPLLIWMFLQKRKGKWYIYAIGQDESKAYVSAVPVKAVKISVHIFAGFAAGLGGIIASASLSAGDPLIGETLAMTAIAASVIGGVSLRGGRGSLFGALFGVVFYCLLISIVISANISSFQQRLIQNVILLIGVIASIIMTTPEIRSMLFKRGHKNVS